MDNMHTASRCGAFNEWNCKEISLCFISFCCFFFSFAQLIYYCWYPLSLKSANYYDVFFSVYTIFLWFPDSFIRRKKYIFPWTLTFFIPHVAVVPGEKNITISDMNAIDSWGNNLLVEWRYLFGYYISL